MFQYDVEWFVNDEGTQVRKLLLHLPEEVAITDVKPECFNVYVERKNEQGELIFAKEKFWDYEEKPARGYRRIIAAYPANEDWEPVQTGRYVVLELDMTDVQSKTIIGGITSSYFVDCQYRVTQIAAIGEISGMVFDERNQICCPQTKHWHHGTFNDKDMSLQYAYFNPRPMEGKRPVIIWLHGAGEGGMDPRLAYMGNKVVALSSKKIQKYFGGAWVLAPQSPTVWMDDGVEQLGRSGKSIYTSTLKALIDEFVAEHDVDTNRIYVGGCSNGGFMTLRLMIDYPGYFAAGYPMCEALYDNTISDEQIKTLAKSSIWFLHAMTDGLVPPMETSVPTYKRLMEAGAKHVHITYIDDRPPFTMINHGCWVPGLNEQFNQDFDMQPVCVDGKPVTRFEWLAAMRRK